MNANLARRREIWAEARRRASDLAKKSIASIAERSLSLRRSRVVVRSMILPVRR